MNQKPGDPAQCSERSRDSSHQHQSKDPFQVFNCMFTQFCSSATFHPLQCLVESLQLIERIPCSFNTFRARSCVPAWISRVVRVSSNRKPLWPVPPPLWRWTGNHSPGPKQRKRRRVRYAKFLLLQRVVCFLNWITLGYPDKPPLDAQAGECYSDDQIKILECLERHIDHFCDVAAFDPDDLGRFGEKFSAIHSALQELPQHADVDLEVLLQSISQGFDAYTSYEPPHFAADPNQEPDSQDCQYEPAHVPIKNLGHKTVVASRIKWKHPPKFDPRPYLLDPIVASVFDNPDSLRLPASSWPNRSKARVHCARPELNKLMKIWDAHGSLALFPCNEVDPQETVGLFAVPKDSQFDRLIINPTVLNSRLVPYSHYTKKLAPGALLSLLSIQPHQAIRFCADDLSDFYYTFKVPRLRAKRNCIGVKVFESEVKGFSCFNPSEKGPFYPALNTLAMGDGHAVEIAQGSHHALLQIEAGSMRDSETLEYRKPVPRGDFIELLAIDDHIGVQKIPLNEVGKDTHHRDSLVFDKAQKAYQKVGLVAHPGKARRHQTRGTLLGADLDGVKGRVSAPRIRVCLLMKLTAHIAKLGTCTRQLLASVVGCWVHVILFRRPLLSLIDVLFKEGLHQPPTKVFQLSSHARHELISLTLLGCCAQADLRVQTCPKVFSLDASPTGGAIVAATATAVAVEELWRHSEQRGYHTNLLGPAASILKEIGYDPEQEKDFLLEFDAPPINNHRIPRSLEEGFLYDCVELFRGSGGWSESHASHGLTVHDGFERSKDRLFFKDLSDDSTYKEVIALALRRVVREWHAGPPCLTYGTLRRPRLRNVAFPAGFNPADPLTAEHNLLARRTAMLGLIAVLSGVFFSCEQPGSSVMFRLHLFRVLVQVGCVITRMAFCNFGSAFNKPSQWLHNKGWLLELEGSCKCKWKHQHFVVQGNFTRASIEEFDSRCIPDAATVYGRLPKIGEPVSSFSARYPCALMNRMAQGSCAARASGVPIIPMQEHVRSFARVGLTEPSSFAQHLFTEPFEPVPTRPWFEDPEWIGEIADSLLFKTLFQYRFKRPNHINVLESQVFLSWIKHCAKSHRDSRLLGLLDSRVTIGAAAKGRSSSFAISRVLKKSIPYQIGSNIYPGSLHVYSSKNRADAPSRDREVEPPTKAVPLWLHQLLGGDYRAFDLVCQSAGYPKLLGRWVRLLLLLAGDIERNPGPSRTGQPRGDLDLSVGFCKITANRMTKCLEAFARWLDVDLHLNFDTVVADAQHTALALRAYGMHLYKHGFPRYIFVYALTAIQDQYPQHRPFLSGAWHIDRKWQVAEPGRCRPVLSLPMFRAALCLSLLWGWPRWTAVTMLAFSGMLHPAEFIQLTRRDLMLPRDTAHTVSVLYIHLRSPKTFRFARQQHVKISDPDIISFVDSLFGTAPLDLKIFAGTISMYRNQWNAVMEKLGIPCRQLQHGVTPGSLRGSGATNMYLQTENIPLICWRGRWARVRTLEFYLQEVAAQVLHHSLSSEAQSLIDTLNNACFGVFTNFLHERAMKLAAQVPRSG